MSICGVALNVAAHSDGGAFVSAKTRTERCSAGCSWNAEDITVTRA